MGWLSELLQGIPLNAVLRERVGLAEQKFKDMEAENKRLQERVTALMEENEELKRRVEEAPVAATPPKEAPKTFNGLYYFGGDMSQPYCPRCYELHGKKHTMADQHGMAHKCTVCGNVIHNA